MRFLRANGQPRHITWRAGLRWKTLRIPMTADCGFRRWNRLRAQALDRQDG